jgi:hypothetical protein
MMSGKARVMSGKARVMSGEARVMSGKARVMSGVFLHCVFGLLSSFTTFTGGCSFQTIFLS